MRIGSVIADDPALPSAADLDAVEQEKEIAAATASAEQQEEAENS